jgi:two-component system LytT family sensor kinase
VAPEVLQAVVPVLSLQPLVENAVRHGVERRGQGRIEIIGRTSAPTSSCACPTTASGMDPRGRSEVLAGRGGMRVGIANVQARLQTSFGPDYGLEIDSRPGAARP